jgi:hypothetical protein
MRFYRRVVGPKIEIISIDGQVIYSCHAEEDDAQSMVTMLHAAEDMLLRYLEDGINAEAARNVVALECLDLILTWLKAEPVAH